MNNVYTRCAICGEQRSYKQEKYSSFRDALKAWGWTMLSHPHCRDCTKNAKEEQRQWEANMKAIKLKYGSNDENNGLKENDESDWKENWGWWTREDDRASELF
jgi:hypothetical protein